jgi:sensor histidine kinase regulating citrate/malate metabolism
MLKMGQVDDAIRRINEKNEHINEAEDLVNTGLPSIDAILSEKVGKARKYGIDIGYTIIIDGGLEIDQHDIAVTIASALDNAIEGVVRSDDVSKVITLNMCRIGEYISILVENDATGPIYDDYRTTKPDKNNHGFGMRQMREVSQKYNGSFRPSYDKNKRRFSLKIMLKNQKTN